MNKTYSQAVADIKAFRKDVNDYLDRVETEILAEVNLRKEKDELTVSELKADQLCMRNEIKSLEEKLKLQSNKANELFVAAKIMTNRKVSIDKSIKQMKEKCQIQQYRFEESPELNVAVSSKVPLGKLKGITRPSQKKITDMEPQFDGEINIKAPEDKLDCFIIASVLISPSQIVLADNENSCVKLVDIDQENMLGRYELCTRPVDMTVVNEDRIAVTLPNKQKIQVLSITKNGTFVESHDIKMNDDVRKIAYQRDNLIIAYSNAVEIRNSKGKVVKKLNSPDFTCITKIAVAPDCKTFYVSNSVDGGKPTAIYKFDFDCNLLATYKDTTMSDVRGLTVTTDGTLLVCNWADNGSIHMISPQCMKIKEFLQHNEHANSPYCVSFCGQTSKLLLCSYKAFSRDAEQWNVLKMFRMM
ncbi:uncharacterized protein LOC123549987 [Mercenaria mercenaria]|uniref:uncharacterized protein LOC123549987 n=1 Tax=Mercenaria mercenaria TaxID=6596 RepID=UPI00234F6B53|nr:uncharacterized protein LOC123549987 [Mercenaria mercenaria]